MDVADIGLVDHVERDLQDDYDGVCKQKPEYQRCNVVFPKCAFGLVCGFAIHGDELHLRWQN